MSYNLSMAIINTIKITTSKVVKLVWSRTVNGVDLYSYSPDTVSFIRDNVRSIRVPESIELPLFMMPTENDWDSLRTFFEDYLLPWSINVSFLPTGKSKKITIGDYLEFCGFENLEIDECFVPRNNSVPPRDDWRKLPVTDFMFALRCAVTD